MLLVVAMMSTIIKFTWFTLCMLLFSYNAWRCVGKYLLFETVTKSSQEGQDLHEFPMICLGPENLSDERASKLNMTPKEYQKGGKWRTEIGAYYNGPKCKYQPTKLI